MHIEVAANGDLYLDKSSLDIYNGMTADQKNLMYNMIIADRKYMSSFNKAKIDRVIFNGPATIVFWSDGDKTVVKCMESDTYNYETGVAMCMLKKIFGKSYTDFKKYTKEIGK